MSKIDTNASGDFLQGAEQIAEFLRELGLKVNTLGVFYLCEKDEIPHTKFNGRLLARKSAIKEKLTVITANES